MKPALLMALVLICLCVPGRSEAARPKIKLLFFCCGGGGHDFKAFAPVVLGLLERAGDFVVTRTDDFSRLEAPGINQYDVVLFYTQGGTPTAKQEQGLTEFVRSGKGFAGIHGATATFKESEAYWQLIGGRFKGHTYETFPVRIEDTEHPITCWLKDFEIKDETYSHNFHEGVDLHVLARRPKDHEPVVWVREFGKGRVFYNALGHDRNSWENPDFQEITLRGIYWAAGRAPKSPSSR